MSKEVTNTRQKNQLINARPSSKNKITINNDANTQTAKQKDRREKIFNIIICIALLLATVAIVMIRCHTYKLINAYYENSSTNSEITRAADTINVNLG